MIENNKFVKIINQERCNMSQKPFMYTADQLFEWLNTKPDFILLDVRNEKEFSNWSVEGPNSCPYINIPYFNFMEEAQENIELIPKGEKIRIVCAKEGSAKYVADLLTDNGFTDVGYLQEGIVGWGNALIAKLVTPEDSPYRLYQCIRPGKASLSYLLCSEGEAFVIDPSRNIEVYINTAKSDNCKISKVFETHRQADYISGCQLLQQEEDVAIIANDLDFEGAGFEYTSIKHGSSFQCGAVSVRAIHTPGHTMGSTCFIVDDSYLLSGDTVFITTVGRPDLGGKWEPWSRVLYLTLALKLRDLKDDLVVLPSHYDSWGETNDELLFIDTLGKIKNKVDAFAIPNELKFKEFIHDNMRPQPSIYAEIRRVNGGWLKPTKEEHNIMDLGKNECSASNYGKVGMSAEA